MEVNYYFNIVFDIGEKYSLSHEGVLTILNGGIIVDGDLSGGVWGQLLPAYIFCSEVSM